MRWIYFALIFISTLLLSQIELVRLNSGILIGSNETRSKITFYINPHQVNYSGDLQQKTKKAVDEIKSLFIEDVRDLKLISIEEQIKEFDYKSSLNIEGLYSNEDLKYILMPIIEGQLNPKSSTTDIQNKSKQLPYIDEILYTGEWEKKLNTFSGFINSYSVSLFFMFYAFVFIFTFLITRSFLNHSQAEFEIYALFGKTPSNNINPYFIQLAVISLLGFILAFSSTYGLFYYVKDQLKTNDYFSFLADRFQFLNTWSFLIIVLPVILSLFINYRFSYKKLIRRFYNYDPT